MSVFPSSHSSPDSSSTSLGCEDAGVLGAKPCGASAALGEAPSSPVATVMMRRISCRSGDGPGAGDVFRGSFSKGAWGKLMGLIFFQRWFEFDSRRFSCVIGFIWFCWWTPKIWVDSIHVLAAQTPICAGKISCAVGSVTRSLLFLRDSCVHAVVGFNHIFCWQNPDCLLPAFLSKPSFPSKSPHFSSPKPLFHHQNDQKNKNTSL